MNAEEETLAVRAAAELETQPSKQPQPTAERFVDLLFPLSVPASVRQTLQKDKEREGTR